MNFEMYFTVEARANRYLQDETKHDEVSLVFRLTKELAEKFLFRFHQSIFEIEGYKVVLRFDTMNVLNGICLLKDDYTFVVKNFNQFISEILEGYMRIRTTNRVVSLLELDVDTITETREKYVEDDSNLPDEFDVKNE